MIKLVKGIAFYNNVGHYKLNRSRKDTVYRWQRIADFVFQHIDLFRTNFHMYDWRLSDNTKKQDYLGFWGSLRTFAQ